MFSPSKYGPTKVFLSSHFSSNIVTRFGWTITFRFTKLLLEGASRKSTRHLKRDRIFFKYYFYYILFTIHLYRPDSLAPTSRTTRYDVTLSLVWKVARAPKWLGLDQIRANDKSVSPFTSTLKLINNGWNYHLYQHQHPAVNKMRSLPALLSYSDRCSIGVAKARSSIWQTMFMHLRSLSKIVKVKNIMKGWEGTHPWW